MIEFRRPHTHAAPDKECNMKPARLHAPAFHLKRTVVSNVRKAAFNPA